MQGIDIETILLSSIGHFNNYSANTFVERIMLRRNDYCIFGITFLNCANFSRRFFSL